MIKLKDTTSVPFSHPIVSMIRNDYPQNSPLGTTLSLLTHSNPHATTDTCWGFRLVLNLGCLPTSGSLSLLVISTNPIPTHSFLPPAKALLLSLRDTRRILSYITMGQKRRGKFPLNVFAHGKCKMPSEGTLFSLDCQSYLSHRSLPQ